MTHSNTCQVILSWISHTVTYWYNSEYSPGTWTNYYLTFSVCVRHILPWHFKVGGIFVHSDTDFFHWLLSSSVKDIRENRYSNLVIGQFMLIQCVKKRKNRNDLKHISMVRMKNQHMNVMAKWSSPFFWLIYEIFPSLPFA